MISRAKRSVEVCDVGEITPTLSPDGDASRGMGLRNVAKRPHVQPARPRLSMDWSQNPKDQGDAKGIGIFGRCEGVSWRPC
mgnify:CR=1 FL=1